MNNIVDDLKEIRSALYNIDIESPTVPEYIEHHKQVQGVLAIVDAKLEKYKENQVVHLCESCKNEYPVCTGSPKFGNGIGNDNVVECDKYDMRGDETWVSI